MKQRVTEKKRILFGIILVGISVTIFLSFLQASHVVTTADGGNFSVNEDVPFLYNISVNNTDQDATANITEVNITLPASFTFIAGTNGTDAGPHTFINTSNTTSIVLSWSNSSGLVMNLTRNFFWFNATATTPGTYNMIVTTKNASGTFNTILSVTVNDTTPPTIHLVSPANETITSVVSQTFTCNITDNTEVANLTLYIWNSTGNNIYTNTTTLSGTSNETSWDYTLPYDGVFEWNCLGYDTASNSNWSSEGNYTITLDTTPPTISFVSSTTESGNYSQDWIAVNVSASDNSGIDTITIYLYNSTGLVNSSTSSTSPFFVNFTNLNDGTYYFNATVNDSSGNTDSTDTRTVTIDTIAPNITLISPSDGISSTVNAYNFKFNVSDNYGVEICYLILDGVVSANLTSINTSSTNSIYKSSISVGNHVWSINCTDFAGNTGNSEERGLSVLSSEESVISGRGVGVPLPIRVADEDLEKGYRRVVFENGKLVFDIDNTPHTLEIKNIETDKIEIEVASEPQKATLSIGEEKKFELTGDNYYDLFVKLNSIDMRIPLYPKAEITLKSIHEAIPQPPQPTPPPSPSPKPTPSPSPKPSPATFQETKSRMQWLWIFVSFVVITFIIVIALYYSMKKKTKSKEIESFY